LFNKHELWRGWGTENTSIKILLLVFREGAICYSKQNTNKRPAKSSAEDKSVKPKYTTATNPTLKTLKTYLKDPVETVKK